MVSSTWMVKESSMDGRRIIMLLGKFYVIRQPGKGHAALALTRGTLLGGDLERPDRHCYQLKVMVQKWCIKSLLGCYQKR